MKTSIAGLGLLLMRNKNNLIKAAEKMPAAKAGEPLRRSVFDGDGFGFHNFSFAFSAAVVFVPRRVF